MIRWKELESVMCDIKKICLLFISFVRVSLTTSNPSFLDVFYDVTHDTFQRFSILLCQAYDLLDGNQYFYEKIILDSSFLLLSFLKKLFDVQAGREGKLACLLHWSPKSSNNVILFVDLTTLGTFLNFNKLVHKVECPNVSTTICNLQKGYFFCIIIGDVHQFIDPCLIPL